MLKKIICIVATLTILPGCGALVLGSISSEAPQLRPQSYQGRSYLDQNNLRPVKVKLWIAEKRWNLSLPNGSKVYDALEAVTIVKYGKVCCDVRDITCIDGLCGDLEKGTYWLIVVNGNSQNYSSRSRLSPGDVVELVYLSRLRPHQTLEDWLRASSKGK